MRERNRRIVVTGLGALTPLGNDVETTWERLKAGQSGIAPISLFDAAAHKTRIAGEVKGFDATALFGRKEARRMSRLTQLILAAANQALADTAVSIDDNNRRRIGVIVGSGVGSLDPIVDALDTLNERGPDRVSPFFIPMMLADAPAGIISIAHGLQGPNMSVATACATGNNAIGEAAALIRRGAADMMLAGGSEACIMPLAIAGFNMMGAMSTRNDAPASASRPFDRNRDGFVPAEGAAILVLEALEHALARNGHIYGELLGYGAGADAYHISSPLADGSGAALTMKAALAEAQIEPDALDYINAHGTSTPLNDKSETAAIKLALGEAAYRVPISSTKSMVGHMLGAAGALEAIVGLLAIRDSFIPPTINYETPDPACDLDYVPNVGRTAVVNTVMSNAFGFGGHNATLILRRYRPAAKDG